MRKYFSLLMAFMLGLSLHSHAQYEEVGTLNGQLSVAPNGAAVYSIQLDLPEGRGGMTPQIALQYNSQAGDGVLGKGWGISGWSYVGREAETPYYNGLEYYQSKISRVDFIDDGFSIDGSRLIYIETINNSYIYRFEIDNATRIIYHDPFRGSSTNRNTDDSFFEVQLPNGSKKIYGKLGSKQIFGAGNPAIRYYLDMEEDLAGNLIKYDYNVSQETGEIYLKTITYGQNSSSKADNNNYYELHFTYLSIPQAAHNYIALIPYNNISYSYSISKLLHNIELVYVSPKETEVIKKWKLDYKQGGIFSEENYNDGKSFLKQITLSNGNNDTILRPTVFDWTYNSGSDNNQQLLTFEQFETGFLSTNSITGDFDGDSYTDIVERYIEPAIGTYIRFNSSGYYNRVLVDTDFEGDLHSIDVDGNGSDELFICNNSNKIRIYTWRNSSLTQIGNEINGKVIHKGDFNGDGLADLILENGGNYFIYPGNPDIDYFPEAANRKPLDVFTDFEEAISGRFFGNAKTGLVVYEGTDLKLFTLQITTTTNGVNYTFGKQIGENTHVSFDKQTIDIGDFNGDGKDDLLMTEISNGHIYTHILYSNGSGFENSSNLGYWGNINWFNRYRISDFNNDGVSDILTWNVQSITSSEFVIRHTFLFKTQGIEENFGFAKKEVLTHSQLIEQDPNTSVIMDYLIGDFNGNGENDVLFKLNSQYNESKYASKNILNPVPPISYSICQYQSLADASIPDDRITGITNGLGAYKKISYTTYHAGKFEKTRYPVLINKKPYSVVSKIENQNPQGSFYPATIYGFNGMMLHSQGKGFLGFQKTIVTNQMTNTQTTTHKALLVEDGLYYFPYDSEQTTTFLTTNKVLSATTNRYEVFLTLRNKNNQVFKPILTRSVTNQWDIDAKHSYIGMQAFWQDMNALDAFGNSELSYEIADEWATGPSINYNDMHFIKKIYSEYNLPTISKWLMTPKYHKTVFHSKEAPGEIIDSTSYTYNENGLTASSVYWPNGDVRSVLAVHTSYDKYDQYGNLNQITLSAPNDPTIANKVTHFDYEESSGRFMNKKSTEMSDGDDFVTMYSYETSIGQLKTQTSVDGNTTSFKYNAFGRPINTILPDGTSNHTDMMWCKPGNDNAPDLAIYCITNYKKLSTSEDRWHEEQTYYDQYSRELRKTKRNLQGETVFYDFSYNLNGLLEIAYEPYYKATGKELSTNYKYDELGRNSHVILPDKTIISHSYSGRKTITTKSNEKIALTTEKTVNIKGETDWIEDATMAINYDYDGKCRLRKTHVDASTTEIAYDAAGNQQMISDPDAGITRYFYNAFGELVNQIDAKSTVQELTYDKAGRIKTKKITLASGLYTFYNYSYENLHSNNGFALLRSQRVNNGNEITYQYDNLSRITQKTETINQNSFTFDYTYNPTSGMLETYTYPSGFALKYVYNNRGDQHEIRNATSNVLLWEADSENQRNQITKSTAGNGTVTDYGWSEYGFPQLNKVSNGQTVLQHFTFDFNATTGNLNARYDKKRNLLELFDYDEQLEDRLTYWSATGGASKTITYQPNGNISSKTDVSTASASYRYQHPQGKPHAVTAVIQPTTEYASAAVSEEISYTSFNKIETLTQAFFGPSIDRHRLRFTYGPDQQRCKMDYYYVGTNDLEIFRFSKFYLDNFERVTNNGVTDFHYLSGPTGLFAILLKQGTNEQIYFVHKDYLGSISAISDAAGNLVESLSYDPWGRRRNPNNWNDYNVPHTLFDRGYTGHEHLDQFGLINMNGRVYDPFLARFLSPDPFVQAPEYSQNYNRYSYALNNPLKYTDPSGFTYAPVDYDEENWFNPKYIRGGGLGAGSGNHWSDQYRSPEGNFMLGNHSTFDGMYGNGAFDYMVNLNSAYNQLANTGSVNGSTSTFNIAEANSFAASLMPTTIGYGLMYQGHNYAGVKQVGWGDRVDLTKSTNPISDIFNQINKLKKEGNLTNLYDIIVPNAYANSITPIAITYKENVTLEGHEYSIRVHGYHKNYDDSYFNINQMGFGYLDRFTKYKPDSRWNNGYSNGFFMTGYEKNYLITIGAKDIESYYYLKSLFYNK